MSWSKEHIISEISITSAVPGNPNANPPVPEVSAIQSTEAKFRMNNPKIFVPVVALSINANMKFFEKIKQGIKRTISWNKCRSDITTETKNNNLDYLVDPAFRNINRLFVVSSKNGNNDPTRNYFNNKLIFDQPVKNKQEAYEKLVEMSRNDNYTTGNLLDYLYHQKFYKNIGIDLSRQKNTSIPQQINYDETLQEDDGAPMLLVSEKQEETILSFSLDSLIVTE